MTGSSLSVLAVDDEVPQLDDLARLLGASPRVAEVATACSAQDAIVQISRSQFDAIFLDVRMPELDGLELARVLRAFAHSPALVFVSAFDTSAVATYELRALDYLMKPVTPERVEEALGRVVAAAEAPVVASGPVQSEEPPTEPGMDDVIVVDNVREGGMRLLSRTSILYMKAYGDYVRVFADSGRYLRRASLTDIEREFRGHGFVRVHRQYLVNLRRAIELRPLHNGTALLRFEDAAEVPVARRMVPALRRHLRT